jgi:hypothetical protein
MPGVAKTTKTGDVQARLERLEQLLEKAVLDQSTNKTTSVRSSLDYDRREPDAELTPSSSSQTSHGAGLASDDKNGTLLLEGGHSKFVSSLHYALLADEVSAQEY